MSNDSTTYKILNSLGMRLPPSYQGINPLSALKKALIYWFREFLHNFARFSPLFGPFSARWVRPLCYRWMGAKVGRNVFVGRDVFLDPAHPNMITLEDEVGIGARTIILAHRRDLSQYYQGDSIKDCEYYIAPVVLKRGVSIGVASIILPGVTIGEGAIVSAGTLVNKSIPPYTLVAGYPAKLVKRFPVRSES